MTAIEAETETDPLRRCLLRFTPRTEAEAADVAATLVRVAAGAAWDRSSALHTTASALVLHPPSGRVLLRWHARQQAWLQVGGHGDPGEDDPLAVVLREGREETGLTDLVAWPTAALRHVAIVAVPANDLEPAHRHADLRFFLATRTPDLVVAEDATASLRWLTPEAAIELTTQVNVQETIARAAVTMAADA